MVKNSKYQKSKMAAATIFKKIKNRHSSAAVRAILTKFGMMTHFDPLEGSGC